MNLTTTLTGVLTRFDGVALGGGEIRLLKSGFEPAATTLTDDRGQFELKVPKGEYLALYACKDYKEKYLEFWYWDIPVDRPQSLQIKIDGLEIYGLKTWRAERGAMAFFRPMSLMRYQRLENPETQPGLLAPSLTPEDITLSLDDQVVPVWGVTQVPEYLGADSNHLNAYLVHFDVPRNISGHSWQKLTIEIVDRETNERGMGCAPLR